MGLGRGELVRNECIGVIDQFPDVYQLFPLTSLPPLPHSLPPPLPPPPSLPSLSPSLPLPPPSPSSPLPLLPSLPPSLPLLLPPTTHRSGCADDNDSDCVYRAALGEGMQPLEGVVRTWPGVFPLTCICILGQRPNHTHPCLYSLLLPTHASTAAITGDLGPPGFLITAHPCLHSCNYWGSGSHWFPNYCPPMPLQLQLLGIWFLQRAKRLTTPLPLQP